MNDTATQITAEDSNRPCGSHESRRFWLGLAGVVALGALIRFVPLGADEYWLDELHSMGSSAARRATFEAFQFGVIFTDRVHGTELGPSSTLSAVWYGMRDDTHPPLYFMLLNLWRRVVGDGEAAERSLSATCSLLSIVVTALLFRKLGRPYVGLFAACLLALAFAHIHMAQQNRQYSQALMFVGFSYYALISAEDSEDAAGTGTSAGRFARRWRTLTWSTYTLTLCLCVLTHYFTTLALAGQIVYAAVRFRGRTLAAWIIAGAAAVSIVVIIWGNAFLDQQWIITRQPWLSDTSEGHTLRSLMRVTDLPLRLLFQLPPFRIELWRSAGGVLLLALCCLAVWRKPSREALLTSVWFFVPCLAFVVTDISFGKQTLNHIRYPVVAVLGLSGLIALALAELKYVARLLVGLGLCAVMLVTLSFPTTSNPDARVAVAELQTRAAPDDLLVFDAVGWPADWIPQFFAPMEFYMGHWPNPMLLLRDPPSSKLRREVAQFDRVWVVSPRVEPDGSPSSPNPSPATHKLTSHSGYIWQIGWIYLFERDPSDVHA